MNRRCTLAELAPGAAGRITGFDESISGPREVDRLMELGVIVGAEVQILHEGPFGRDPIAIKVRGGLLGLRRDEARQIQVEISR